MNGRLYDPALGRFLRADPFVQFPANLQGHNRYSYALNNPLAFTDPSGYLLKGLFRPLASIAISVWLPGAGIWTGTGLFAANGIGAVAASGFIAGAVGSGSLKGAVTGAFTAAAFHGVGGIAFKEGFVGSSLKALSHGAVGGIASVLAGGRFGHGFISAAATQVAAGRIGALEYERQRVIASAVLGGTVSAATGGKFANGAVTSAFGRTVSERQQRWKASQRTAFQGRPTFDSDSAAPEAAVAAPQAGSAPDSLERDLNPPREAADPASVPAGSEANVDFSATGGTDASFDRPSNLQVSRIGGISAQALREQQLLYAGTSLAAAALGFSATAAPAVASAASALTSNTANIRIGVAMLLELNSAVVSFANQYLITNAVRQIPSVYVQTVSRESVRRATYAVTRPKGD